MTDRQPPRLAAWLLDTCAVGDASDAIAGDLLEEYQRGKSATWYWRQVAGSIAATTWQDLRSPKGMVFRAIVMGWMSAYLTSLVAVRLLLGGGLRLSQLEWGQDPLAAAAFFAVICGSTAVSGWVVARFHTERRGPIILSYLAISVLFGILVQPWNSQFLTRDVFLSLLPFQLAYCLFGFPLSVVCGAMLAAEPLSRRFLLRRR